VATNISSKSKNPKAGQKYALQNPSKNMTLGVRGGWSEGECSIVGEHVNVCRCDCKSQKEQKKSGNLHWYPPIEASENQKESSANFGNSCPEDMVVAV
jgi:hypothetical protein